MYPLRSIHLSLRSIYLFRSGEERASSGGTSPILTLRAASTDRYIHVTDVIMCPAQS